MVNGVMKDIPLSSEPLTPVYTPSLGGDKLSQSDKSSILSDVKHGDGHTGTSYMTWIGSVEFASKLAAASRESYLLYFCPEKVAPLAGEGKALWETYKKEHGGTAPEPTLFENEKLIGCFQGEGLRLFVKIPHTPENLALYEKFNAGENTLLVLDPDGKKLATFSGQDANQKRLHTYIHGDFARQALAWKKPAAKAEEAKAPAKDAAGGQKTKEAKP
jgi:hypothetical protein